MKLKAAINFHIGECLPEGGIHPEMVQCSKGTVS